MQKKILPTVLALFLASSNQLKAQYSNEDISYKKCFVGSTFWVLGNFNPKNRPGFIQLNLGYRITYKDAISLESKT